MLFKEMVFTTIESDLSKTGKSLAIFGKEWRNVVNDITNVKGIKNKFKAVFSNSITNDDIVRLREYNHLIEKGQNPQSAFYRTLRHSSAAAQDLAMNANGVAVSEETLTAATNQLTFAQKASTVASKAFGIALKAALNIGFALAINAIISGITYLVNKQEELKQKHEEEIQKSKELVETLKEENTTLETIIDKYSELSKKTGLTADEKETLHDYQKQLVETYGKEASGIDLVNGKLENNLAILKSLNDENLKALEANQKKVYLDAKAKYDDFANEAVQYSNLLDEDTGKYIGVHRIEFDDGSLNGNVKKTIQSLINGDVPGIGGGIFADHLQIDDDAIEILGNTNEDFEMAYAEMVKILDEISKRSPMVGGVDFTTNSGYETLLDGLNQLTALRDEAEKRADDLAHTKYTQFTLDKGNAPVDETNFKKWLEELMEYANPTGDSALKNALTDIVNSNSGRYIISDTDTGIDKIEQKSLSDIVASTKTELDDYKKEIDKFVECQSTAKAALTELSESGTLSYETIKKLSEAGLESVISYNAVTNSFAINKEKLDELIGSQKDAIVTNMEQSKSNIQLTAQQSKELKEIESWRKRTGRSTSDVIYQHKLEELGVKGITSSYDLYISMLEKADFATSNFSDTVSKTNQDIEKYSENISKISNSKSIVKSAQEEQEKFGRLSIDTIKSLHEVGLSGAMSYNEMTGETYLLVDAIDELTRAQIENQKIDINKSITETTNKIAEASERLRNIKNPSDAYILNQNIAQWQSQLDELGIQKMELGSLLFSFETDDESTKQSAEEAAEKALEEYINSIKEAFDKEKSDLDHLLNMDVISQEEYYNRLFGLNEKYFKGKTELLDEYRQYEEEVYKGLKQKQIDAIQEQIDALKSVNEEKQEEIDLEKAKQALENAKRNKTISVYDSERGWINETDRKAIDTAQKEYDDLVLNEKIEALENMIDAIENGTNTSHSLDESVDVIQQVGNIMNGSQEDFINNIKSTLINHGENPIDYINQLNSLPIDNVVSDQMLRSIQTMQENIYTTNNKRMTVNIDKVVADDPMRFAEQMEQIANKSFDTKFMPAMNDLAEDIKRHRANHSSY